VLDSNTIPSSVQSFHYRSSVNDMPSLETPPLKILIVGAGIAGLSAAISCRRAGHDVQIYERSALNNELGAAIHVAPNASRGLLAWGLDPVRSRFVTCKKSYRAHASTLEKFHETDEAYIGPTFGAPWFLCHRVDLHEELKRLAIGSEGEGKPAEVHLKSEVVKYVCLILKKFVMHNLVQADA
jgi:salicylate hydroxylase